MKSLFNKQDNEEIINRINKLSSENKPEWGKMNAAQMLAHSVIALQIPLEDVKQKRSLMGIVFGGIAKKKLVNEEPFKKNLPTDKKFVIQDQRNFEEEKNKLIKSVQRFGQAGPNGITKEPHPFFGELTSSEWDCLMWKHLDHHLRQFGV